MSVNLQQQIASNPKNSVAIFASAGSGKTKVLIDRLLRLILDGVDVGGIICITYTNAAASEIKNRINSVLLKWAEYDDSELNKVLERLLSQKPSQKQFEIARKMLIMILDNPFGLKIFTIHALCQLILAKFPVESMISPEFRILDDYEKSRIINDISNYITKNTSESVLESILGSGKFDDLIRNVIDNSGRFYGLLEKFGSVENVILHYENEHLFDGNLIDDLKRKIKNCQNIASEIFQKAAKSDDKIKQISQYSKLDEKYQEKFFDDYCKIFMNDDGSKPKDFRRFHKDKLNDSEIALLQDYQGHIEKYFVESNIKEWLELTKSMIRIAFFALNQYKEIKDKKSILDYNDLIFLTKKLLSNSQFSNWVKYKMDEKISHILLDEAQDTSEDQWEIVNLLSEEFFFAGSKKTIFLVGDDKQSIYGFQGAKPATFGENVKKYSKKLADYKLNFESLTLQTSFRSLPNILKFVDEVFASNEMKNLITSGADKILHNSYRKDTFGLVELWSVPKEKHIEKTNEIDFERDAEPSQNQKLANLIIDKIEELVANKKAKYSDIAIFFRSRSEYFNVMIDELNKRHVPNSGADRIDIANIDAIKDLSYLVKFVLYPSDDFNLGMLLKSTIFSISENDLFQICHNRNGNIFDVIKNDTKYSDIYSFLMDVTEYAKNSSIYGLVLYILEQKFVIDKFLQKYGVEIFDILDNYIGLIVNFEKNNGDDLQKFDAYFYSMKDISLKKDLDYELDEVKLMTIHASKGLEFPVVFIADSHSKPVNTNPESKPDILWDADDHPFWKLRSGKKTEILYKKERYNMDNLYAESMRLLYVSMTRARDRLYIIGIDDDKDEGKNWYGLCKKVMQNIGEKSGEKYVLGNDVGLVNSDYKKPEEILHDLLNGNLILPQYQIEKHHRFSNKDTEMGNIIHKAFDIFAKTKNRKLVMNFMQKYSEELTISVSKIIENPEFAWIFEGENMSETSVICNGELRRIDKITITEEEVFVVDYKYSLSSDGEKYRRQITEYRNIMTNIFKNKIVKAGILFVKDEKFIEIV